MPWSPGAPVAADVGVIETMDDCCIDKTCAVDRLRERQSTTLRIVLLVNAAMFVVELVSGLLAASVALLADSLDMLGDRPCLRFQSLRGRARPSLESAGRGG